MEGASGFRGVAIHSLLFNGLVGAALGLLGMLGFHQTSRMFILRRELIVNVRRHMTPRRDRVTVRKKYEYN
jgi:hypothetical protein